MQTRNARIETLGGAIVRFPFGVTVRRALVAVCGFAALASCATLVGCSSDEEEEPAVVEEPQDPEETQVSTEPGIPITITAEYAPGTNLAAKKPIPLESVTEEGYAQKNRIAFTDNGTDVSAVWEAGDQIYVVCNGKISLLSLESGAGTNKGTFVGDLAGYSGDNKPAANTELICYVRNRSAPYRVTVQTDGTFKDNRDFMAQAGTLHNAGSYTIYRGTAKYGTGSNIVVDFKIHDTCLMKFEVNASNGVAFGTRLAVTYFQGNTALASTETYDSHLANMSKKHTFHLAMPSGVYSGQATLGYTNQTFVTPRKITLGSNKYSVTLETGKYYTKTDLSPYYQKGDYIYEDGTWGELENHPSGAKGIARIFQLEVFDDMLSTKYTHGYACALQKLGPIAWESVPTLHISTHSKNERYSGLFDMQDLINANYAEAPKQVGNYNSSCPTPALCSDWFLPSAILAKAAQNYLQDDEEIHSITELAADVVVTSKTNEVSKGTQLKVLPVLAF